MLYSLVITLAFLINFLTKIKYVYQVWLGYYANTVLYWQIDIKTGILHCQIMLCLKEIRKHFHKIVNTGETLLLMHTFYAWVIPLLSKYYLELISDTDSHTLLSQNELQACWKINCKTNCYTKIIFTHEEICFF